MHAADIQIFKLAFYPGYKVGNTLEIRQCPSTPPPPIWLICSGVGCQWVGMLKKYSQYPLCAEILEDLTQLLLMHSFDLTRLVYSEDIRLFDDPKSLFVGLAVVQCLQVLSSLMTVTRSSISFYKMTWSLFCDNNRVLK